MIDLTRYNKFEYNCNMFQTNRSISFQDLISSREYRLDNFLFFFFFSLIVVVVIDVGIVKLSRSDWGSASLLRYVNHKEERGGGGLCFNFEGIIFPFLSVYQHAITL